MVHDHGSRPQARPRSLEGNSSGKGKRVRATTTGHQHQTTVLNLLDLLDLLDLLNLLDPLDPLDVGERPADSNAGDRDGSMRSGHVVVADQPWTRLTQIAGFSISSGSGRVCGEVHTALNPSVPTLAVTARTKTAPSRY